MKNKEIINCIIKYPDFAQKVLKLAKNDDKETEFFILNNTKFVQELINYIEKGYEESEIEYETD